jgi:hypothetical protein
MITVEESIQQLIEDHIIPELAEAAFMQAYRQALANGRSVLKIEHGFIVEVFPDGSRRKIKEINLPIPVPSRKKRIVRHEQNTTVKNVCGCERVREKYTKIISYRC